MNYEMAWNQLKEWLGQQKKQTQDHLNHLRSYGAGAGPTNLEHEHAGFVSAIEQTQAAMDHAEVKQ